MCQSTVMKPFHSLLAPVAVLAVLTVAAPAAISAPAPAERPSAPGNPLPTRVLDADSGMVTFTTPPIDLQPLPAGVRVIASFTYLDAVPSQPEKVQFTVMRVGAAEKWRPGEQITLRTAARRLFWNCDVSSKESNNVTIETARADIETPFFLSLMKEDSISLEIGKTRALLDKGWLAPLKELAKKIPPK